MSSKIFCDICDQELVIPDEKIDFISGQPTGGKGDICWQCRLSELVDLYNEKTKGMKNRPVVGLFTTTVSGPNDAPRWIYSNGGTKPEDWDGHAQP